MKNRAVIIASCALAFGASASAVAHAADQRSPGSGNHTAPATHLNGLANLGHEGSGLAARKRRAQRTAEQADNGFANLGREGSGLTTGWETATVRPWAN